MIKVHVNCVNGSFSVDEYTYADIPCIEMHESDYREYQDFMEEYRLWQVFLQAMHNEQSGESK